MHGGIGATIKSINQIENIPKSHKVNHEPKTKLQKIIYKLLWTDPCQHNENQEVVNTQHDYFKLKKNLKFSQDRVVKFCDDNDLITIIRSHQSLSQGFQLLQMLITVFSISDYGGMGNKGGILHVKKNSQIVPKILNALPSKDRWLNLQQIGKKNYTDDKLRYIGFSPIKK